jgi:hypothetical protein
VAKRAGAGQDGGEPGAAPRGEERKAFLLRLPPRLLADLRAWANQDLRSLNAQIEFLLADALRRRKGGKG